ncbi:conserved membrane hypothetical protein [[Clostridium] ultunense Esp]|nr:sulfite exporter TauE/SafE family protein [Schnuerera ultunensis]CCQ92543.1 conserved membrane hypothetical protein [[Clostridium] ultunense Esp]
MVRLIVNNIRYLNLINYTIKESIMHSKPIKLIGLGLITGVVNGLFGSGGGTLVVPALVFLLGIEDYKAHATAISIILPLSLISSFVYLKNKIIRLDISLIVVLGGILGSAIGAKLLKKIPIPILRKIFGSLIIYTAIRMIIK